MPKDKTGITYHWITWEVKESVNEIWPVYVNSKTTLFYKLGNPRKLKKLGYEEEQKYKPENNYDGEFLRK